MLLLSQIDNASYPSVPHVLSWILGIGFEFIVTGINIYIWTRHLERSFQDLSSWKIATLVIDVTRVLILVGMTVLYAVVVIYANLPERSGETETSSLLDTANGRVNGTSSGYGSVNGPKPKKKDEEQQAGWARRNLIGARQSWWEYLHGYTVFFPYLWPATSRRLQFLMLICFLLMLAQRGVNVLVPNQLGNVVKLLGHDRKMPRKCKGPAADLCRATSVGANCIVHFVSVFARQHGTSRLDPVDALDSHRPILVPSPVQFRL